MLLLLFCMFVRPLTFIAFFKLFCTGGKLLICSFFSWLLKIFSVCFFRHSNRLNKFCIYLIGNKCSSLFLNKVSYISYISFVLINAIFYSIGLGEHHGNALISGRRYHWLIVFEILMLWQGMREDVLHCILLYYIRASSARNWFCHFFQTLLMSLMISAKHHKILLLIWEIMIFWNYFQMAYKKRTVKIILSLLIHRKSVFF